MKSIKSYAMRKTFWREKLSRKRASSKRYLVLRLTKIFSKPSNQRCTLNLVIYDEGDI